MGWRRRKARAIVADMVKALPIEVGGRQFATLSGAAKHFGVSLQAAARRLRAGWTPAEAFGLDPPRLRRMTSRGVKLKTTVGTFRTLEDAERQFGVPAGTIQARLARGWAADQAVGIAPPPKRTKDGSRVQCAGEIFRTIVELAEHYGKPYLLVRKRLQLGWSAEQAVELSPRPSRFRDAEGNPRDTSWKKVELVDGRSVPAGDLGDYKVYVIRNKIDNREYVGITISPLWLRLNGHKACMRKGVGGKLYNAMRKYGADNFAIELVRNDARNFRELQEHETAEIERRGTLRSGYNISPGGSVGTPKGITVGGVTFGSLGAAAQYFGIDPAVFNLRLGRLRWTPEQAAEIEPRAKYARRRVVIQDKPYPSLKAAAEAHGQDYKRVHERVVRDGWSVGQAVGQESPPGTVKYQGLPVNAYGEQFRSLAECARKFGIKPETPPRS